MTPLYQIEETVRLRAEEITAANDWPCRKGCDDCCRHLAAVPVVSRPEWERIDAALKALPREIAEASRIRILESGNASRPVVCPLLATAAGACLIYDARPVACRAYGFYAEREYVLGCARIESIGQHSADVVWGNHAALEAALIGLGPTAPLFEWLASADHRA